MEELTKPKGNRAFLFQKSQLCSLINVKKCFP